MTLSTFRPGCSPVHRLPPGLKLAALAAAGTAAFAVDRAEVALAILAGALLLYRVAGLALAVAWEQVRPALWIVLLLLAVQAALDHWTTGVLVAARLAALLLLASLVTLTTRSSAMIEALERGLSWLAPLGVNPGRASLGISLALRFIPVLAAVTAEVREAQRARGLEGSVLAVAVPVVVRALKMADDVAAALEARGYDP